MANYDGTGATTLWLPIAIHGKFNPGRWNWCVDCGIDVGQYSKHYSTIFKNVLCIDAKIRDRARECLKDCLNISFQELCLSDTSGEIVTWYELNYNTFLSSTDKKYVEQECCRWKINSDTISEFKIKTHKLDDVINHPIDFLKIDCEQSDTKIIKGAIKTIEQYKPTIQIEAVTDESEGILLDIGYKKYHTAETHFTDTIYLPIS